MDEQGIERLERAMQTGFNTLADLQRETNARLDETNARLDQTRVELRAEIQQTNARLDQTNARLDQHEQILVRQGDILGRHEEALVKLVRGQDILNDRFDRFLTGPHREEHEAITMRLDRIESHLGLHDE